MVGKLHFPDARHEQYQLSEDRTNQSDGIRLGKRPETVGEILKYALFDVKKPSLETEDLC